MSDAGSMCSSLLKECHNTIDNREIHPGVMVKMPKIMKKKINLEQSQYGISPHEMEENAKIIDKLRKKYHKKAKEATIKKTNLGEDLLTFTQEQYAKLQLIDECQSRGLTYNQTIDEQMSEQPQKKSAVDRLKQLAKLDDVIDEVKNNLEWGSVVEKINLKQSMQRSSSYKKIGFQKRAPFRMSNHNLLNAKMEYCQFNSQDSGFKTGKSLNRYYFTALNKKTIGKKHFLFTKNDSTIKNDDLSFAQKLEFIKEEAFRKTANICKRKSPFMTEQRKQAIYGCQMLRNAKKILKPSQMQYLQLSVSIPEGKNEEKRQDRDERREKKVQCCQAEYILKKNEGRIKEERKRNIEKIVC